MKTYKIVALLTMLLGTSLTTFAQQAEMADTMRSNGKIYVVVAVVVLILLGFIAFLVMTDKKVAKLENEMKANDFLQD
ncbi:MAG: CcmD family protein [Cytophagales bacterium]|nr:CcmD family protein [Cytophagales bacterium]